jgi:hypothetical protein
LDKLLSAIKIIVTVCVVPEREKDSRLFEKQQKGSTEKKSTHISKKCEEQIIQNY